MRSVAAALVLLVASHALAEGYTVVPERFVYCTTCHGVELKGNRSVDAPRLNGMPAWYVQGQLEAFKRGWRGTHPEDTIGMDMQPQARVLTEDGIRDAAAFVAAVPERAGTTERTVDGDPSRGAKLYETCAACHGPAGAGSKPLNAPALASQSDWYLVRQLRNYQAGARGFAVADTAGRQMRAAAAVLESDQDTRDVVAYINSLD
ncbi:MAG: c-type cytochrome [Gammaproteobacteria bacterium]